MWVPDERRLFGINRRDEFDACWRRVEKELSRPSDLMAAIERGLARGPKQSPPTFPFDEDENQRILRIADPYDAKEVWVYYRVDEEKRRCELGWAHLSPFEDDPDDQE